MAKADVKETQEPIKGEMPVPSISGTPVVKLYQNAPPVIALATPSDGMEIGMERINLAGAAASEKGVARVEIRLNGQLVTQREHRGVAVKPGECPIFPPISNFPNASLCWKAKTKSL